MSVLPHLTYGRCSCIFDEYIIDVPMVASRVDAN